MQVPLPEKPDTEDQSEVIKWKWKVRSVMKENRERPSQRCDVELKLAVSNHFLWSPAIFASLCRGDVIFPAFFNLLRLLGK